MIPSLVGRLQTRVFVLLLVGIPWTLLITPVLPRPENDLGLDISMPSMYQVTFTALGCALVFGIGWEFVYQAIQNRRWEQDFPSLYFLLAGFVEFIPVAVVVSAVYDPPLSTIAIHFFTLWLLVWSFVQGPIRVLLPRWRFSGGRIW